MTNDHPDLVALLRGELSNAEATRVADHLARCDECRHELAKTAVGHAVLSAANRTLSRDGRPELPAATPPESPVPSRRDRARLRPLALVAAAAALVAGTAAVLQRGDEPSASRPSVAAPERTADLEPVEGAGSGRVVMARGAHDGVRLTIETRDLPRVAEGQFYEVWLFDPATRKMLPLGVLGPGGRAAFDVPGSLVGRYGDVDVSLERDDGDPDHSVTSVLRATYAILES